MNFCRNEDHGNSVRVNAESIFMFVFTIYETRTVVLRHLMEVGANELPT